MQSERQKMVSCQLYNPADPELKQDRITAQDLCFELAQLRPSQLPQRVALLQKLFQCEQADFHIEMPFRCDYGYNISLGKNFYSNYNCTMLDCAKITIGDNVMFAPNVSLFTAMHPIDAEKRNSGIEFAMPITIGNNVWVGGNAVIMPNVTIGNNVVIGAGSVVTKDIPDNCVAVGNPCRVLRAINEQDKIFYFKEKRFE
ncbi:MULTISPECIES: sugar O-acetyltransferase [Glaesserella]|uniref:Acetyltransferase n=1 Tax=Glaesserella australis TaxID=2094024 RepID=A0A328BWP0_9PAST|nr:MULTISPECIES: sugar O-acetyltransferase [Glaesserella]AUI65247.1 maltose O-acetyltransferase [Glaesserella sp. 15-184]RAL18519.1 maltose O-acetyltransferase [Glaesserella australis]